MFTTVFDTRDYESKKKINRKNLYNRTKTVRWPKAFSKGFNSALMLRHVSSFYMRNVIWSKYTSTSASLHAIT